ncbi:MULTISPECIES: PadR family transcriptional regulator [unclassified Bacillus (in: firmicutes)]|uniref:PadR family transcriptional regulator n=1 Tax=Bacillaceae TaxID=186817 RepID=UPI0006AE8C93|nr:MULTISPECIES: PadR family transcriptional regulator [unclassified Bacillus (in: firmicutes)]ALC87183.1 transcriptional regulator [Bacillus sp. FJAT-22090]MDF2067463.1 PadR family transcriptional regulator [Bacillus sp. Cr_A10]
MKKYNHTTYAILGILTTECRSGYAIKQLIDQSLNHFWKISYGQIYPTLKLIVDEGLATVDISAQDGKPDRKEYSLTSKGIETLKVWLEQPIEQIPIERNEVLLKLFFGRNQSIEHSILLLNDYKEKLEIRYQTYENIEQVISTHNTGDDLKYWLFTLDYGKRITKAAIEWCIDTLKQLENKGELK